MLSRYLETCRYIEVVRAGQGSDDSVAKATAQRQVENLVSTIETSPPPPVAEAASLMEELQAPTCRLSMSHKEMSSQAVQKAMSAESRKRSPGAVLQTHMFMYNYLTKEDWETLVSETVHAHSRIELIVCRALSIGLYYPSELTCVAMLAIVSVAGRELWSPDVSHGYLVALKASMKLQRKVKANMEGHPRDIVSRFPVRVASFLEDNPVRFDYSPIDPPVSVSLIEQRKVTMAARKTHRSLRETTPPPASSEDPIATLMRTLMSGAAHRPSLTDVASPASRAPATPSLTDVASLTDDLLSPVAKSEADTEAAPLWDLKPEVKEEAVPLGDRQAPVKLEHLPLPPAPPLLTMKVKERVKQEGSPRALDFRNAPIDSRPPMSKGDTMMQLYDDFGTLLKERAIKKAAASELREKPSAPAADEKPRKRYRAKSKRPAAVDRAKTSASATGPKSSSAAAGGPAACSDRSSAVAGPGARVVDDCIACRPAMPPLAPMKAIVYRGCKIYASMARKVWRVYPYPGLTVYDKKISWAGDSEKAWATVLDYCEAPTLPDSRKADVTGTI